VAPIRRRKLRSDVERIRALRRLIDFWDCVESLFQQSLPGPKFKIFEEHLLSSDLADEEVLGALDASPKLFSLSMLQSQRKEASHLLELRNKEQLEQCAQAREEVWDQKLRWFEAGLRGDQDRIEKLAQAGPQVQDKIRVLYYRHRQLCEAQRAQAVHKYLDENMKLVGLAEADDWRPQLTEFASQLAWPSAKCAEHEEH
jgi:hypothetical protein